MSRARASWLHGACLAGQARTAEGTEPAACRQHHDVTPKTMAMPIPPPPLLPPGAAAHGLSELSAALTGHTDNTAVPPLIGSEASST